MSDSLAKKNQKIIKNMAMKGENLLCFNCQTRSTPYVIMDYGIFVCSYCSGIHRSFQHKVKGITMTNFKKVDVKKLKQMGGNKPAARRWRATHDPRKYPRPKPNDEFAISKFIEKTFVKREWEGAGGGNEADDEGGDDEKSNKKEEGGNFQVGKATTRKKKRNRRRNKTKAVKIPEPKEEIVPKKVAPKNTKKKEPELKKTPAKKNSSPFGDEDEDWGDFDDAFNSGGGPNTKKQTATPQQPNTQKQSGGGKMSLMDLIGGDESGELEKKPTPVKKKEIDIDSLFSGVDFGPKQPTNPYGQTPGFPQQQGYGFQQQQRQGYGYPQQQQQQQGFFPQQQFSRPTQQFSNMFMPSPPQQQQYRAPQAPPNNNPFFTSSPQRQPVQQNNNPFGGGGGGFNQSGNSNANPFATSSTPKKDTNKGKKEEKDVFSDLLSANDFF